MSKSLFGLCIAFLLFLPLAAQDSTGVDLEPELEKEAKELESQIIAPCCWRQPVAVHFSPAADQVRAEIRQMLAQGMDRQEILDAYVNQYGEKILAKPKASGFNALAYFLPVIFLVVGAGLVFAVIRRLKPQKGEEKSSESTEPPDSEAEPTRSKLERELWG